MMAIFSSLDCVPPGVRDTPRYVGDHVIRHYRPLGLAALLRDLGLPPETPQIEIVGGIGRLVLRHDGEVWDPTATVRPPRPMAAPSDLAARRSAACSTCSAQLHGRCTAASCGCAGEARPEVLSSRCPLGRWP